MTESTRLTHWLRQLGWALSSLPVQERDDIVRETRSHLEDRVSAGLSVDQALAEFGSAERHARAFIDEIQAYEAMGSQRAGDLVRFVANRAHRNLAAAAALLLLLLLGVSALIVVGLVGLEVYDPVRTGLWIGRGGAAFVGVIDDPAIARETLGPWLYPVAALSLTAIAVAGRLILLFAMPLLAARPYPRARMST